MRGLNMKMRTGEPEKTWFRTERFFTIGSEWFVATREGTQVGPFLSRQAALKSLAPYLNGIRMHKDPEVQAKSLSKDCWSNNNYR